MRASEPMDVSWFKSATSQRLRAQGLADGVLLNLTDRGIEVPDEVRERIESCEDRELLQVWHSRANRVERVDDVFRDAND